MEINQNPGAGVRVVPGSAVAVTVSSGPCAVGITVPEVTGKTESEATAGITSAGLTGGAITQQCSNSIASGKVISQNPSAGIPVNAGSAVGLVVSTGTCPSDEQVPPSKYTVTVNIVRQGLVTLTPPSGTYNPGMVVSVTASPSFEWLFGQWDGDLTVANSPAQIIVNESVTIEAIFVEVLRGKTQFTPPIGAETLELRGGTKVDGAS